MFDSSLIVFSADHGEEFFEHGGYSHTHKLYDELLHVPFIVSLPGARPGVVSDLTALIQIAPTMVEYGGISASGANFEGESLLPALRRQLTPRREFILAEVGPEPHANVCARTKEWKLILRDQGTVTELYQLSRDPCEQVNLALDQPDRVRELEAYLADHRHGPDAGESDDTPETVLHMTPAEEQLVAERLRDLGYL